MTNEPQLLRFSRPYDLDAICEAVNTHSAVIIEGLMSDELRADFDQDVENSLAQISPGRAHSEECNAEFQGVLTKRMIGLLGKMPNAPRIVAHPDLMAWAEQMLEPMASSVTLTLGELIEIGPGQASQFPHRDTGLWPHMPLTDSPVAVNAIVAISEFTKENGATLVVPGSHYKGNNYLEDEFCHAREESEFAHAVMQPGDALLFRCDAIHAAGTNSTDNEFRRALSLTYQAGWLRTFENHMLSTPPEIARNLPEHVQDLIGYTVHDGGKAGGGVLGVYDGGHPRNALVEQ